MWDNPFSEWLIKIAISNSGKFIRLVVGGFVAIVVRNHIIPGGDAEKIQTGLEQGGYALAALAYAAFEFWVNAHHKQLQKNQ